MDPWILLQLHLLDSALKLPVTLYLETVMPSVLLQTFILCSFIFLEGCPGSCPLSPGSFFTLKNSFS